MWCCGAVVSLAHSVIQIRFHKPEGWFFFPKQVALWKIFMACTYWLSSLYEIRRTINSMQLEMKVVGGDSLIFTPPLPLQVLAPSQQPWRWPRDARPLWSESPAASCSNASPVSSEGWILLSAWWSGTASRRTCCSGPTAASTPCSLSLVCLRWRRPRSTGIVTKPPTTAWCPTTWLTPLLISYRLLRNWTNRATDESVVSSTEHRLLQVQCWVFSLQQN